MFQLQGHEIMCPYCGEFIEVFVDPSVSSQRYIEDCQVCCRPITISVTIDHEGDALVGANHENA